MARLDGVFDRGGGRRRPSYARLLVEVTSLLWYRPAPPDPGAMPNGNGHIVLVVPAFLANDYFTGPLRRFLARCGYRPVGWEAGFNWGPSPRAQAVLRRRLAALCHEEGGPVIAIGVSLGGIMVRDLAYDRADEIRHVVTIVSPFNLPTASTVAWLIRLFARLYRPAIDVARLATPLPVAATAIYSRDDGVVAWQSCRDDAPGAVNIECGGPHLTVCRNPKALRSVAERIGAASAAAGA
jgi:hypothetical protein